MFLKAARHFDPPIERVVIPFRGGPGEGDRVIGYLRIPRDADGRARLPEPLPLVVHWCGVDSFKEDREQHIRGFLARGLPVLLIDMPGTGDAPVVGSLDAERMFDAVFDWVATESRLDTRRICAYGGSFGGYWSTKVAHTHRERLACAVSQGGCTHLAFEREWMEKAQSGEYAFEFAETHAHAFGVQEVESWMEFAPTLSLLRMGILDRPCAPLLLINGIHDTVYPIEDIYLLLQHGSVKTARFYATGHMGVTRDTQETIVDWVSSRLVTGAASI
jgi:esterase FrsA